MISSLVLGVITLPVGIPMFWHAIAVRLSGGSMSLGDSCLTFGGGGVIIVIALLRIVAGLRILRGDGRASTSAHTAACASSWGEAALVVLLLVVGGFYGVVGMVLLSPYLITSLLQSIALEKAAGRLDLVQ